jgi:hypothetical protein
VLPTSRLNLLLFSPKFLLTCFLLIFSELIDVVRTFIIVSAVLERCFLVVEKLFLVYFQ